MFEEGCGCFSCGFLEGGCAIGVVLGGGGCVGDDVAEDGEGLGSQVGVDGGLAVGVDLFDGFDGLFVLVCVGEFEELVEGEVVGLADLGWGHRGIEEGFEEVLGELDLIG